MEINTTSPAFFEEKYRRDPDPWSFNSSTYELERYSTLLRALEGRRYGRAFEPGCSVGVLTERLAGISALVEAIDCSETAVNSARERCAAMSHVRVNVGSLPDDIPGGKFDLLVLSEIGYYFSGADWRMVTDRLMSSLQPGGTLLAAHWLGHSPEHLMHGDTVHSMLRARTGLLLECGERYERPGRDAGFRLDKWVRV